MRSSRFRICDFDCTLTKHHTISPPEGRAPRFYSVAYTGEDHYSFEAQMKVGVEESGDLLKAGIPDLCTTMDDDNTFAVATFHNNHAFIAGVLKARFAERDITYERTIFLSEDEGASPQFAVAIYRIAGIDKQLLIAHIHVPDGKDELYPAFVSQYEGSTTTAKNTQLEFLYREALRLGVVKPADLVEFRDDSLTNCTNAADLNFMHAVYCVSKDPEFREETHFVRPAPAVPPAVVGSASGSSQAALPASADVVPSMAEDKAIELARQLPGTVVVNGDGNGYYVEPGQMGVLIRNLSVFQTLPLLSSLPQLTIDRAYVKVKCQFASAGVLTRVAAETFAARFPGRPIVRESSSVPGMMVVSYCKTSAIGAGGLGQYDHLEFTYDNLVAAGANDSGSITECIEREVSGRLGESLVGPLLRPVEMELSNYGVRLTDTQMMSDAQIVTILSANPDACILRPSSRHGKVAMSYCDASGVVVHALVEVKHVLGADSRLDFGSVPVTLAGYPIVAPEQAQAALRPAATVASSPRLFASAPAAPPAVADESGDPVDVPGSPVAPGLRA